MVTFIENQIKKDMYMLTWFLTKSLWLQVNIKFNLIY